MTKEEIVRGFIEIRDSLKLLKIFVKRIVKSFTANKRSKLTPEEKAYLANDCLIVKEVFENYIK